MSRLLLPGWGGAAALMAGLWLVQRRRRDATVVDAGWAFSLGAFAVFYALAGGGWGPRRALVALMAGAWALRLVIHILARSGGSEDPRYAELRRRWGDAAQPRFFLLFQANAALAAVLSLSFLAPCLDATPRWALREWAAVLLWGVSVGGEALSDSQLERFKARPESRGRTCREGLWRWSRHPNYFFEWLHWWCYPLLAGGAPSTLPAPFIMLWLLLKVTGIPMAEERALASRGDDYRAYQRETSAFVPWPPRRV